ncbi:MAG: hypothetical protein KF900_13355 [Bacteroidetes bacterium]|nr:hypothetical protein [Bacteroidota bacterium]
MKIKTTILFLSLIFLIFVFNFCDNSVQKNYSEKKDTLVYLNHSDTAKYVGMNTCKLCHQDIYNSFIETGMGKSFDLAGKQKSSGNFSNTLVYDNIENFHYQAFWAHDSLYIKEFRTKKYDTTFTERVEEVERDPHSFRYLRAKKPLNSTLGNMADWDWKKDRLFIKKHKLEKYASASALMASTSYGYGFVTEYSFERHDTIFSRTEQVNYIIGSGQHTNSHLQNVNGYLNQMPMTYYTQKKQWDLPPGFENGFNSHFSRKIGLECMTCHNAYPDFVLGSENKYTSLPNGIDCERCHGAGSIHVAQRSTGSKIDTSKYIDYSIVNPAKLSIDRQFDICQRCHLQGNAVLKNNHSFFDFKPGQKLSDYISVFLPKYKNADDEFIMASHADRLKQSQCFIKSLEKVSVMSSEVETSHNLKPYKNALTCVTCHNPHVSVRETNKNTFNDACNSCHNQKAVSSQRLAELQVANCGLQTKNSKLKTSNCVSCHMPSSGSTDIPHVSVHDHFIRKPITKKEKEKIKTFIGLYCINEKQPDSLTKARAYLQQYEKFEQNATYLDSAKKYLKDTPKTLLEKNVYALLQLCFMKQDYNKIIFYVNILGEENCYQKIFIHKSYDNKDAWASYQIAEAFLNTQNLQKALRWFSKSVDLAPYNLEFRNKYGAALAANNQLASAEKQFEFVLKEHPKNSSAYTSLGYLKLLQNKPNEAFALYQQGLALNPDYEPLLLNLAGYYAAIKDYKNTKLILEKILKKNPNNKQAKMALKQIQTLS